MSVDLSAKYLGLELSSPLVTAACSWSGKVDNLKRLEAAGVAAAVLPSLFEEQIEHEETEMSKLHDFGTDTFAEALTFFPEPQDYRTGPESYLELIEEAKKAVSMPIIASLNGTSEGGWIRYAKLMQDAGADALELNIYYIPTGLDETAEHVERQCLDLVGAVKQSVSIPLGVKIGPHFSAIGNMCKRLVEAGADGLVLFNRFIQPDIDLETMESATKLELTNPYELLLPLRWIAILRGGLPETSIALTRGIHSAEEMIKAIAVGADVGMVASMIYKQGVDSLPPLLAEMRAWLEENEYESISQLRGSMSQENCPNPADFARGNYMKALTAFTGEFI